MDSILFSSQIFREVHMASSSLSVAGLPNRQRVPYANLISFCQCDGLMDQDSLLKLHLKCIVSENVK